MQGNVVRSEEYDNEYWVYLSAGTKRIKVLTQHHAPLEVKLSDYIQEGVSSQATYQLNLHSDLPPEVLYGSVNPLAPIDMSKTGEPLLPTWWNLFEDGMYVGISPISTFDGEVAKRTAVINAIYSFVLSSGCDIEYESEIDCTEEQIFKTESKSENIDKTIYKSSYKGLKKGFDIKILQEYYNSNGEFFVLCAISEGSNSSSQMSIDWVFTDEKSNGSINVNTEVDVKINRMRFKSDMRYTLSWTPDSEAVEIFSNGKKIVDKRTNIRDNDNIAELKLGGDLGLSQLRLLTAIPLMTNNVIISENTSLFYTETEGEEIESINRQIFISGFGHSISRNNRFYDYIDRILRFGVSERFPDIVYKNSPNNEKFSLSTGLSNKYDRKYIDENGQETAIVAGHQYEEGLFEVVKNLSFLQAMEETVAKLSEYLPISHIQRMDYKVQLKRVILAQISPLYYLDPEERIDNSNKTYRKNWVESQKKLKDTVSVIIPIESLKETYKEQE